ncbi:MAG: D-glycero-beta-D-manno-heptose-7-phosphate kinase [Candidatus Omnitrophica bacterium]|nr:D-glycero-beta-D-manno-heptose-7-phosphate kinase [Candidatus Omnitrophota bacterium]
MRNLKRIVRHFLKARILVLGDIILDEYIWGDVERISPEAPVPVVWAKRRSYLPGGAANVANNISSLKAKVSLVGVVGEDKHAEILFSQLRKRNIPVKGIFVEVKRHTTLKTRIIAGHQQVVRVDWEHIDALSKKLNDRIIKFIRNSIDEFDAIIIEDYGKGVINPYLLERLTELVHAKKKIITVDPKEEHFHYYRRVTSITPNRKELENAIRNLKIKDTTHKFDLYNDRLFSNKDIELAGRKILSYLELESLLVTLGEQGMKLFAKDGSIQDIPTKAQEVFDVSGAGDTVISVFTLGLCAGGSFLESAQLANYAAGIVVGKIGTAVTNQKELLERIG